MARGVGAVTAARQRQRGQETRCDNAGQSLHRRHLERKAKIRRGQEQSTPRRGLRKHKRRRYKPAKAVAEQERRQTRGALSHQAFQLGRVVQIVAEVLARASLTLRSAVPAKVDANRSDAALGPAISHMRIAPPVLGVAVHETNDGLGRALREGRVVVQRGSPPGAPRQRSLVMSNAPRGDSDGTLGVGYHLATENIAYEAVSPHVAPTPGLLLKALGALGLQAQLHRVGRSCAEALVREGPEGYTRIRRLQPRLLGG